MARNFTDSARVQAGIDKFIEVTEARKDLRALGQFLKGRQSVYNALDNHLISEQDFKKCMSKLSAAYFRFKRDNPDLVMMAEEEDGKKTSSN